MNYNTLNDKQKRIYDEIVGKYEGGEIRGSYILNAPAGTGKSYLSEMIRARIGKECIILAPTHKACSLYNPKATTIHKFFNSSKETDEDGFQTFNLKQVDKEGLLLIVDECSMLTDEMVDLFNILSTKNLILFSGDRRQLPPIRYDNETRISKVFNSPVSYTLTDNMRSRDSLSAHLLRELTIAVDTHTKPNLITTSSDKYFEDVLNNPDDDIIMLAYTNKKVKEYNDKVRMAKYKTPTPDKVYPGEKLILTGYRRTRGRTGEPITYYSNSIITAETVEEVVKELEYVKCPHQEQQLKETNKYTRCQPCGLSMKLKPSLRIPFIKVTDPKGVEWFIPKDGDAEKELKKLLKVYRDYARKVRSKAVWAQFYSFRDTYMFKYIYKYALTVHRAQGSGWNRVYVDLGNILWLHDIELRYRLLYTAASRMKETLVFV